MKRIIKELESTLNKLNDLIQDRNDKINDASEKWQESERGEFFIDQTDELEEKANDLLIFIDDLKEIK